MEVPRVYETGNETCYLLYYTHTWQHGEEMSTTSTEQNHSLQVETIKIEEIEDDEQKDIHLVVSNESRIVKIEESFMPETTNAASKQTFDSTIEHCETKTKMKHFSCGECEQVFKQKRHLLSHMVSHEGTKPFVCDQCESRFAHNGNLKRHKLTHEGTKPFACDECEKRFTQKQHLRKHKLSHEGLKP